MRALSAAIGIALASATLFAASAASAPRQTRIPASALTTAVQLREAALDHGAFHADLHEGNLFALIRYPGDDALEGGLRANLGLHYLRTDPAGWTLGVTLGRVVKGEGVVYTGKLL